MMEEQTDVDPDYVKGFNEGYTMALYMPEFAEKLVSMEDENPRNAGFKAGREQLLAEKELNKNILPVWLRALYPDAKAKDQQLPDQQKDVDKDSDIEPEMH